MGSGVSHFNVPFIVEEQNHNQTAALNHCFVRERAAPAEVVLDMGLVCRMCLWNISAAGRDAWQWLPSGDGDQCPERTHQATQLLPNHHRHCYWEIHQVSVHLLGLYSSADTQTWVSCSGSMIYNTHTLSTVAWWFVCIVWWKLFKWREAVMCINTELSRLF